jgi:nitroreductase
MHDTGLAVDLDAVERAVHGRRSSLLLDRTSPVDDALVDRLCALVTAAPNHKRTAPWRIAAFAGDGRAALGEALAADLLERDPETPAAKLDKTRTKYTRAPVVLAVGAAGSEHPVRHREDLYAVAAGVQNLLLGASAAGLAALWSSPPVVDGRRVLELCGFGPTAELVALVYLGHPTAAPPPADRPLPTVNRIGDPSPG